MRQSQYPALLFGYQTLVYALLEVDLKQVPGVQEAQVRVAVRVHRDGGDDAHAHAQLDIGLDDVGVHGHQHVVRRQAGALEGLAQAGFTLGRYVQVGISKKF